MENLLKIYPSPAEEIPLAGAYLAHNLRQLAEVGRKPFIYANFITSLDGRIAVPHPSGHGLMVPKTTANERDWRLFQELAAQADILISSGRYLRDWAKGRAQEILQVDDPSFTDLQRWRMEQGLPPHPDIAILSATLDFPIPAVLTADGRRVIVFTVAGQDKQRIEEIRTQAGEVIVAGVEGIDGRLLLDSLSGLGYRTVYSSAGPRILHLLLAGHALDRLYLTYANRLLGGQPFSSLLEGPLFEPPVNLMINEIFLDPDALDGSGQLFVSYNVLKG